MPAWPSLSAATAPPNPLPMTTAGTKAECWVGHGDGSIVQRAAFAKRWILAVGGTRWTRMFMVSSCSREAVHLRGVRFRSREMYGSTTL
jgi:hypothetical protein